MNKCFDMFIYIQTIIDPMQIRDIWVRLFGLLITLSGILLIALSGKIYSPLGLSSFSDSASEFILRGGFGLFMIGLLTLFLFSWRSIPENLSWSFLKTEVDNLSRNIESLDLKGNGIYIPGGGRLSSDRVFIPLEKRAMPIPKLDESAVYNVGQSGQSMGVSIIPPGKGLIDEIEGNTGEKFRDERLVDATEALERVGKGTGLIGRIDVRDRRNRIELTIEHTRLKPICDYTSENHPDMHLRCGCPGCSAVLCAISRIAKTPLRIDEARKEEGKIKYVLIKEG